MLSGLAFASLFMVGVQQQPATQNRDTTRLTAITVRDRPARGHRYAAPWSATASKTNMPLRDTPQSVSVITNALILEQSMQNMGDAVRYLPGVTMGQGEGHRDAPTIRGNSSTADFFVDGIRDDAQYYRDLYNVERVEALGGSNAMTFGRGGGGGVINRVTKQAEWQPRSDLTFEGGSFGHARGMLDHGGALSEQLAVRLNATYEHSRGFRDAFQLRRAGVSPSSTLRLGERSTVKFGGEYFEDRRTVDRGLPSFQGRPSPAPLRVFFGNPDSSWSQVQVGSVGATLDVRANDRLSLKTQARVTAYDKFYQNVLPGALSADASQVILSAYSNDTQRENYFAQSEATFRLPSVAIPQTILAGVEVYRQSTDNLRLTGYFGGTSTSLSVPFDAPTVRSTVAFRPSASDANNNTVANVASAYVQDQVWISPRLHATLGVRLERFVLEFLDHRASRRLDRTDDTFSPRAGLVYKPVVPLSLYASYSVSHLPASGDQFSGLTPTTQTLEPERFANHEVGAKWQARPALTFTAAVYELTRSNSAAPSALDPGVIVQTGRQKSVGAELSLNGQMTRAWDVVGSFTGQSARIVNRTSAALEGAIVPLVPRRAFSVWNRYQVSRALGLGLGVVGQSAMYAAIDNSVTLPAFTRLDAAAYLAAYRGLRLQLNVENVLDARYYATSHGNNNIMPGASRSFRFGVTTAMR